MIRYYSNSSSNAVALFLPNDASTETLKIKIFKRNIFHLLNLLHLIRANRDMYTMHDVRYESQCFFGKKH